MVVLGQRALLRWRGQIRRLGATDNTKQETTMSSAPHDRDQSQLVSLGDEEAVKEILSTTIQNLWDVVNNLARLRPSRRDRYRVAIFGSARAQPGTFVYDEVKRVAAALAQVGCDIVTGGGPGLMQAANEGAATAGARVESIGIRVELPFEQDVNPFVDQAFEHKTFFTRLQHFVIASDAFVVVPGGIGTVLEMLMIWQLLQVRHVDSVPLLLVGKMWKGLVDWASSSMLDPTLHLANPEDFRIPRCVETADEAIALVRDLQEKWLLRQRASSV
jgi:uncharacterized protein (TIGR00730 family)